MSEALQMGRDLRKLWMEPRAGQEEGRLLQVGYRSCRGRWREEHFLGSAKIGLRVVRESLCWSNDRRVLASSWLLCPGLSAVGYRNQTFHGALFSALRLRWRMCLRAKPCLRIVCVFIRLFFPVLLTAGLGCHYKIRIWRWILAPAPVSLPDMTNTVSFNEIYISQKMKGSS